MSFIYLASPYTHKDAGVRAARAKHTMDYCAKAIRAGYSVISPIVHCHEMVVQHDMPKDYKFWQEYSASILSASSEVWVLMLDSWMRSYSIQAELRHAKTLGLPVFFCKPEDAIPERLDPTDLARIRDRVLVGMDALLD